MGVMYLTFVEPIGMQHVYTSESSPRFVDADGAAYRVAGGAVNNPPEPYAGEITPELLGSVMCFAGDWEGVVAALGLVAA